MYTPNSTGSWDMRTNVITMNCRASDGATATAYNAHTA
jgi:hypothetical protein